MSRRTVLTLLALAGVTTWAASKVDARDVFGFLPDDTEHPHRLTSLSVGDVVVLPEPFRGRCIHVVAFHGSCDGCERLIRGRPGALWLTRQHHAGDALYKPVFVSPPLWEALGVEAIPVEFVVSARGKVLWANSPYAGIPPSCEELEEPHRVTTTVPNRWPERSTRSSRASIRPSGECSGSARFSSPRSPSEWPWALGWSGMISGTWRSA